MGILISKNRRLFGNEINSLAYINLLVSLATAAVATIWALYINSFTNSAIATGLISGFLTIVSIVAYFAFVPLLEKIDKANLFAFSLFLIAISYLIFSINNSFAILIIISIIMTSLYSLRTASLGIMIKDKSNTKEISKNEGLMFTFINIGWVIAPLVAGYIAEKYNFYAVFDISALLILIALIFFRKSGINDNIIKRHINANFKKNFKEFFRKKERTISYFINGVSTSWWILIYLFVPLYMVEYGFSEKHLGLFFFCVGIPLILCEYYFSKLAGKNGFKKMFRIGFLFVAVTAFLAFFAPNIYISLLLIIIASFGMAMIEPIAQAYFLSITNNSEMSRFYGPFSTSRDIFELLAKIIPSLALIIFPFKFVFIFFGIIMLVMFFVVSRMGSV